MIEVELLLGNHKQPKVVLMNYLFARRTVIVLLINYIIKIFLKIINYLNIIIIWWCYLFNY